MELKEGELVSLIENTIKKYKAEGNVYHNLQFVNEAMSGASDMVIENVKNILKQTNVSPLITESVKASETVPEVLHDYLMQENCLSAFNKIAEHMMFVPQNGKKKRCEECLTGSTVLTTADIKSFFSKNRSNNEVIEHLNGLRNFHFIAPVDGDLTKQAFYTFLENLYTEKGGFDIFNKFRKEYEDNVVEVCSFHVPVSDEIKESDSELTNDQHAPDEPRYDKNNPDEFKEKVVEFFQLYGTSVLDEVWNAMNNTSDSKLSIRKLDIPYFEYPFASDDPIKSDKENQVIMFDRIGIIPLDKYETYGKYTISILYLKIRNDFQITLRELNTKEQVQKMYEI